MVFLANSARLLNSERADGEANASHRPSYEQTGSNERVALFRKSVLTGSSAFLLGFLVD
jgi:hypothetical protein